MNQIADGSHICPVCGKSTTTTPIAHHILPGTILNGKYTVGNVLGEGGFGITYVGMDNTLELKVAIKEFFPSGYANRNHTQSNEVILTTSKQTDFFKNGKDRFLQEARSLAKFTGEPGIVNVRDFFECNNTAYIVMEFLNGADLNNYMKKNGIFKAEDIFAQMMPVMRSLEKIHATGLIHRDISPENIMRLENGILKLMDFGSARHYHNQEKALSVMLKQGYAPEEQYSKNGKQGPWTDVYGLCATIYKCITGIVPEDGLDRIHGDELKKPSELGITINPALERILMYGLAVFRENRCQDMTELMELTQKALRGEAITLKNEGNTQGIDAMKSAMASDSVHKTMIADDLDIEYNNAGVPVKTYQPVVTPQPVNNTYQPPVTTQPIPVPIPQKQNAPKAKKEKTGKKPVALIIIALILVLAIAGGAVAFFVIPKSELGEWQTEISLYDLAAGADSAGIILLDEEDKGMIKSYLSKSMITLSITFYEDNEYDIVALGDEMDAAAETFYNETGYPLKYSFSQDNYGNYVVMEGTYEREGKYIYLNDNDDMCLTVNVGFNSIKVVEDEVFGGMLTDKKLEIVE